MFATKSIAAKHMIYPVFLKISFTTIIHIDYTTNLVHFQQRLQMP